MWSIRLRRESPGISVFRSHILCVRDNLTARRQNAHQFILNARHERLKIPGNDHLCKKGAMPRYLVRSGIQEPHITKLSKFAASPFYLVRIANAYKTACYQSACNRSSFSRRRDYETENAIVRPKLRHHFNQSQRQGRLTSLPFAAAASTAAASSSPNSSVFAE